MMKYTRGVCGRVMNVAWNGELLEEMECFIYSGSKITVEGGIETEVKCWINDVGTVLGGMKILSCRAIGMKLKRRLYELASVSTALYGAET